MKRIVNLRLTSCVSPRNADPLQHDKWHVGKEILTAALHLPISRCFGAEYEVHWI